MGTTLPSADPVTDQPARATPAAPVLLACWSDRFGVLAVRSAQTLLVLLLLGTLVVAALRIKLVVIPLLIALILAAALFPPVRVLRRRLPHAAAAGVALLLGLAAIGSALALAVAQVANRWNDLQAQTVEGFNRALRYLYRGPLPISPTQVSKAKDTVVDFATSGQFGHEALAGVVGAMEVAAGCLLCLVILFFFLMDGPAIWAFLTRALHSPLRQRVNRGGLRAIDVLGGFLRGTAIVALFDTVFIGGTLWILGVPLALPLAILVYLGAFVPIVGATASGVVAALVALVTGGPEAALWVSAVVVVVNQLETHLLSPIVLGKSLHLHSLAVLLALAIGTILGGIAGTLLAVPFTSVAWAIAKSWNEPL